jgi:hypothetical protein
MAISLTDAFGGSAAPLEMHHQITPISPASSAPNEKGIDISLETVCFGDILNLFRLASRIDI